MRFSGSGTGWEGALRPLSPMYPQGALAPSLPLDTHHSVYSLCWATTTRKSPLHPLPASSSTRGSGQLPQPVGWKERETMELPFRTKETNQDAPLLSYLRDLRVMVLSLHADQVYPEELPSFPVPASGSSFLSSGSEQWQRALPSESVKGEPVGRCPSDSSST